MLQEHQPEQHLSQLVQSLADAHNQSINYLKCVNELRAVEDDPPISCHAAGKGFSNAGLSNMSMPDALPSQPKVTCRSDKHGPRLHKPSSGRASSACTAKLGPDRLQHHECKTVTPGPLLEVQGREVLPAMQQLHCVSEPQPAPATARPTTHGLEGKDGPDGVPDMAAAPALEGVGTPSPAPHRNSCSPLHSPLNCQYDGSDFPDHGKLAGPLRQEGQEFSEDDTRTPTQVQPKSWMIDGGIRCSAAAHGLTSQHSHQLPTLQV